MKRLFLLMIATCIFGFAVPILARDIELTVTLDTSEYYKSYEYDEFWDVGCYYLYGTKHTNYKLVSHGTSGEFLDLSGRRLPALPTRKGIYIKDGRKVLIK